MGQIEVYVTNYLGKRLYPLPEASVTQITETLNDVETCTFSIPQDAPNATQIDGYSREIQVWEVLEDGYTELVFCGTPVSESGDANKATFECEGVLGHLATRIVDRMSLLYTSIEQRTIGWNLVAYAQDESVQANRDLNIDSATFTGTTKIRSRNYDREQHATILDLLKEFSSLKDGFDFSIEVQGDGSRLWTPYFPSKGSLLSDLRVELTEAESRGMLGFTYQRAYKPITTHAYVTGGQDLSSQRSEQNFEDVAASASRGVRQAVFTEGNETDPPWLLDRAKRITDARKNPVLLPTITVGRYPLDMRRLVKVGDQLPILIKRGRAQVETARRVIQKKWNLENDTVELTLLDPLT